MTEYPNEFEVREKYSYEPPEEKTLCRWFKDKLKCDRSSVRNFVFGFFPILTWLPNYSLKNHLPGDIIGGVTTAIVRIPQSLAYALLAGVDPVNGMYTAFFSPLVYTFLGTSSHISVGTFAVISLMLGSALEKFLINHPFVPSYNETDVTTVQASTTMFSTEATTVIGDTLDATSELAMYKLAIVGSLTLLAGFIQIGLGILNLGFVALFLSDPLVSGFTTGAAVYVFSAQVKYFFGICLVRQSAPFALAKTYIELFTRIDETKPAEVIISVLTIVLLYPIKLVNVKYKEKLHNIPIPMELIIVIIATIVSANVDLQVLYDVEIVGKVPSGLPSPSMPNISYWSDLASDAFSIAIVSFAITVSIGKLFAKKHGYKIAPNQELFALGVSQLSCAIFQGHACSGSLARSSVKESSGTKTQFSDVVSCAVMLLVLLFIGPLLRPLPVACLSSIIMVNVRTLFHQFLRLPHFWKFCKYDFVIWIVTFVATVLLGVDLGLVVGVVTLLSSVVIRKYNARLTVSGQLGSSNLFRDMNVFNKAEEVTGVKIIKFPESPFFGNKEKLEAVCIQIIAIKKKFIDRQERTRVRLPRRGSEQSQALLADESSDSDPGTVAELPNNATERTKKTGKLESGNDYVIIVDAIGGTVKYDGNNTSTRGAGSSSTASRSTVSLASSSQPTHLRTHHDFHTIIFDCSCWTFMDTMGVDTVKQVCNDFKAAGLRVFLAGLERSIFYKLSESKVFNKDVIPYSSVEYAVEVARSPSAPAEISSYDVTECLDPDTADSPQTEV